MNASAHQLGPTRNEINVTPLVDVVLEESGAS